jgi:hypothetical protein
MFGSPTEPKKTLTRSFLKPLYSSIGLSVTGVSTEKFPLPIRDSIFVVGIIAAFRHGLFYRFSDFGAQKLSLKQPRTRLKQPRTRSVDSCRIQAIPILSMHFR